MVNLAIENHLEALDGILNRDHHTGGVGELLCHKEGLREETLNTTSAVHSGLILIRELLHTENRDDILQLLVTLENLFHTLSSVVVLLTYNVGVEDSRSRLQRIYCGVDTECGNLTREHGGCVEVREGGCGCGVGQVVRRHIYRLYGGDRAVLGRGDSLLHTTHLGSQSRLITYCRRHTTQKCRHLTTCLSETEDVIDEEEDILGALARVTERLSNGQTRECHRRTRTGRLVHLAEHERQLRLFEFLVVNLREIPIALLHTFLKLFAIADNARLNHIAQQVVTLTGTLTHTGEYRKTVVLLGDVVNQLHNKHGLTNTCTTKQTNLTTTRVGFQKVDNLDTGEQHLARSGEILKLGRLAVDRQTLRLLQGTHTVNCFTHYVHQSTLHLLTCRHTDRGVVRGSLHTTTKTVGGVHCNGTNTVLADVLLNLSNKHTTIVAHYLNRVVNRRELNLLITNTIALETNVDYRADNL